MAGAHDCPLHPSGGTLRRGIDLVRNMIKPHLTEKALAELALRVQGSGAVSATPGPSPADDPAD